MPVAKFREEMGKDLNIPFYSSIDDGGYRPREFWSHGMHRGMCSHILSQGADGIYLFNYYFGTLNTEHDGKLYLEDGGQVCRVMMPELLQELGSLETLKDRNKIYAFYEGNADNKSLTHYLVSKIPKFMIPEVLVNVEAMPLTKNGKIDRKALMEGYNA